MYLFSTRHEHAENMETTNISRKETDNEEKVALTEKKIRLTLTNLLQANSSISISPVVESALCVAPTQVFPRALVFAHTNLNCQFRTDLNCFEITTKGSYFCPCYFLHRNN